jgi:hypothetical protein
MSKRLTKSELWSIISGSRFMQAYIQAVEWTEEGSEDLPKDWDWADLNRDSLIRLVSDCKNFLYVVDTNGIFRFTDQYCEARAGHDFWLTRNGHGTGFWDRGLGEAGDKLSEIAHAFGQSYLYFTDSGKIAFT